MNIPRIGLQPSECPLADMHTPAPVGYRNWHDWAERMSKTHKQAMCKGCRRYVIWIPKPETTGAPTRALTVH
jgi:hypothetical protein